jgi:alkylation response protein AidB-like acyl-CoA dehydrogenase
VERGTKGFSASKLEKMGIHASDTAELAYGDCRVPAENIIGPEGSGFKYIMECFQRERLISTMLSVAYCEKVLQATIDFCRNNSVAGSPIISYQANKHKLVEMTSELEMVKVFTYDCCQEYSAGKDIIKEISMAKYLAGELVNKVARNCMGLHGDYGYLRGNVACKIYMDARPNTIAAGTTEIMKEIIGNMLGF